MQSEQADQLAEWLIEQRASGQPYQTLPQRLSHVDDGYRVQHALIERLLRAEGPDSDGIAGYKIGLTSPRLQAMFGLTEPVAGVVLASQVHLSGSTLSAADYVHLGIECELCVSFCSDLPADCTRDYALQQLRAVHASFELIDNRRADPKQLDAASMVAHNVWNAGIVLGNAGPIDLPLDRLQAQLWINDDAVEQGLSGDAIGHPIDAVLWLCQALGRQGRRLRAGEMVMTGALLAPRFVKAGQLCRLSIEGLPEVSVAINA